MSGFETRTMKRKNVKGLALSAPAPKASINPSESDSQIPGGLGHAESNQIDTLEIGLEFSLDLKSEDLVVLKELGAGNGGTVSKVMHATTKVIMARKIIRVDAKEMVRKQIVRELQVGRDCSSPYVITFYGAFQNEARDIVLCMEYMDCGSLDRISKDFGPVRVDVLGKITEAILGGLVYLYEAHRIMHRDIKPSNVLVNSRGSIKLCDFGVATETVNSVANTFVGTSTYMAPERIMGGASYTIKSDVWSVGLTIMELAIGRFPFDSGDNDRAGPMGILDLLQQIVHEPAPKLPKSDAFPGILDEFCAKCLLKKADERPTPRELYDRDNFVQAAKRTPVDLQDWAVSMMQRDNRKSYLAPPAPKSLKSDGTTSDSSYNGSAPSTGSTASTQPEFSSTPVTAKRTQNSEPWQNEVMPQFAHSQHTPSYSMSQYPSSQLGTPQHPPSQHNTTQFTGSQNVTSQYPSSQQQFYGNQSQTSPRSANATVNMPPISIPTGIMERSPPPPLSLQHLSLETVDEPTAFNRSNRLNFESRDNIPEPASAIESSGRPTFPPRTSSSTSVGLTSRAPLQQTSMVMRGGPPTGPLPNPPYKDLPTPPISRTAGLVSPRRQR